MASEEIKQTVYIAVAAVLLAGLLGFVSYLMMLRSEFAETRNSEVYAAQSMKDFREYNEFAGAELYGEDVVAAIRNYYDGGIKLRVNDPNYTDGNGVYTVDKYIARQPGGASLVDVEKLQKWFPGAVVRDGKTYYRKYKAVLVYGQVDLNTVTKDWVADQAKIGINTNVSAIVFFFDHEEAGS